MHRLACRAATLAWCAVQQEEALFCETHDALFREPQLTADTLNRIPEDAETTTHAIDQERLRECMDSPASIAAVKEDIALGRSLGVTGTPIFFVNG